ncbi:hypothetical protein C8J57DRAFT_1736219 [Mycena rebaudengoi]|nr:hypothetical protein C8J57DRAFT_1736219 [Mycena rebaudengoi]
MEGLASQIALLRVEKEQILGSLESITYPVLTLPPEIVSEIILHYVDSSPFRRVQDPLRLASFCREWRYITTSTTLSGHSSLTITVFPISINCPTFSGAGFHGPGRAMSEEILSILAVGTPFSSLEKLKINVTYWPQNGSACITAFADAPQLRAARLYRVRRAQILLPWIQLTNLELIGHCCSEGFEILQQTPNLVVLTYAVSDWGPAVTSPPLLLPHLRNLDLLVESESKLLDHLNTPSLERLKLGRLSAAVIRRVESFIARSGCTVTALHLWSPRYMEALECISIFPSLKELTMRFPAWTTDEYSNLFDRMAESADYLPVLESINLDWCKTDIAVGPMARMLSERWAGVDGATRIISFRLSFHDNHENNFESVVSRAQFQLLYLREQGLKMDIHDLHKWSTEKISSPMMEELLAEETT